LNPEELVEPQSRNRARIHHGITVLCKIPS
jgi:hypothetical protein